MDEQGAVHQQPLPTNGSGTRFSGADNGLSAGDGLSVKTHQPARASGLGQVATELLYLWSLVTPLRCDHRWMRTRTPSAMEKSQNVQAP